MTLVQEIMQVLLPELAGLKEKVDANHREIMLGFDELYRKMQDLERERRFNAIEHRLTQIEREREHKQLEGQ